MHLIQFPVKMRKNQKSYHFKTLSLVRELRPCGAAKRKSPTTKQLRPRKQRAFNKETHKSAGTGDKTTGGIMYIIP